MGLNAKVTVILRDIVQFLECLHEVKLPVNLESIRNNLLIRSKDTLTMFVMDKIERPASPEPYLNMNAATPKGLMVTLKTEAELQEYVGAEEHHQIQKQQQHQQQQQQQQLQHQEYYETFQGVQPTNNTKLEAREIIDNFQNKDEETENTLVNTYINFTAAQTKSKCQMCGCLYRKEGKKLFVFEQYRMCWGGLVGSYLLIYGNDRDNRPCTILPIRGYTARAAPNGITRDQRRSESTFEIFRPGSRTFQFVAKTPKDMEQWVIKICELGSEEKNESKEFPKGIDNMMTNSDTAQPNDQQVSTCKEERYQDVASLTTDKLTDESLIVPNLIINENTEMETDNHPKAGTCESVSTLPPSLSPASSDAAVASSSSSITTATTTATTTTIATFSSSSFRPHSPPPPPLPARIPRRLPSLPDQHSPYKYPDEEEDDIYHKIEEFRDTIQYGNIRKTSQLKTNDDRSIKESSTYDDVRASVKNERKLNEKEREKDDVAVTRKSISPRNELTYDDTFNIVLKDNKIVDEQVKFVLSYDDVENMASIAKPINVRITDKREESAKSPQKKSFLDRVRSKKESPKKSEKKAKGKTGSPTLRQSPLINNQEQPTYYDDVSDLINIQQEINHFEKEQSEYTCPPPPRPVYIKSLETVDANNMQEFYDDVAVYRDKFQENSETSKLDPQISKKPNHFGDSNRMDVDQLALTEFIDNSQRSAEDNEHYKTPRVESHYPKCLSIHQQMDDLYDDVAIVADFTARQKEILHSKRDNENITRSQVNPEKRSWNRFVSGRKSKTIDLIAAETNDRILNGTEDPSDDHVEQQGSMRMNTFQKLISRMENSLGKATARTSSTLLNKTSVTNNV